MPNRERYSSNVTMETYSTLSTLACRSYTTPLLIFSRISILIPLFRAGKPSLGLPCMATMSLTSLSWATMGAALLVLLLYPLLRPRSTTTVGQGAMVEASWERGGQPSAAARRASDARAVFTGVGTPYTRPNRTISPLM